MDFDKRYLDFDLEVNPYDFLGVKRGCRDLKEIKKAYHRKSLLLHPDKRKGNELDIATLNKCYIYLKTLCQELYTIKSQQTSSTDAHKADLEQRMREIQQARLDNEQRFTRTRMDMQGSTRHQGRAKIDFSQPLQDNCIIGADNFDPDRAFANMMQMRPQSTSYRNLDSPSVTNPFANGGKKFNLNQFNAYFDERMRTTTQEGLFDGFDQPLDGFSTFDEYGMGANVVSDGQCMFVQGHVSMGSAVNPTNAGGNMSTIPSFGMIEQFSDYDHSMETGKFTNRNLEGKISEADFKNFAAMYQTNNGEAENQRKMTNSEFKDQMGQLENAHWENMERQRRANKEVVAAQISRLSDATKANLQNSMRITASMEGLTAAQADKFAFPRGGGP